MLGVNGSKGYSTYVPETSGGIVDEGSALENDSNIEPHEIHDKGSDYKPSEDKWSDESLDVAPDDLPKESLDENSDD